MVDLKWWKSNQKILCFSNILTDATPRGKHKLENMVPTERKKHYQRNMKLDVIIVCWKPV